MTTYFLMDIKGPTSKNILHNYYDFKVNRCSIHHISLFKYKDLYYFIWIYSTNQRKLTPCNTELPTYSYRTELSTYDNYLYFLF